MRHRRYLLYATFLTGLTESKPDLNEQDWESIKNIEESLELVQIAMEELAEIMRKLGDTLQVQIPGTETELNRRWRLGCGIHFCVCILRL